MREKPFVILKRRGEQIRLYHQEIFYIERNLRKTKFHCMMENCECSEKLSSFEEKLGENFVRCHNSFLVNLAYVKSMKRNEIILSNGEGIPVSNSRSKATREALLRYLASERRGGKEE